MQGGVPPASFEIQEKTEMLPKGRISLEILLFFAVTTAFAQSTLHIGPGSGTKCATGCSGDPNLLSGARNVDIYQTSNGAKTLSQPVLLILGVPSQYDHLMPAMPIESVTSI